VRRIKVIAATAQEKSAQSLRKKGSKAFSENRHVKNIGYYDEVFALREQGPAVPRSAGVCVELKTNIILERDFEFAKALSEMIAKRYDRSEKEVCVTLDHSACMIMGGTFEGTYILTITSVSLISPTVNKRNAALITEWLAVNLGVPGDRGYIRFVDPDFSNYATGGVTVLDQMEKEEISRTGTKERTGILREKSLKRSASRYQATKQRQLDKALSFRAESKGDHVSPQSDQNRATTDNPGSRMGKRSMFNLFARGQRAMT